MPLGPGDMLLHYRLVEQIGEGGMGVVWRAEDTTLARQVAIKILPERFAADPSRLSRFEREAKTLASLSDPGIAAIYSVHLTGDVRFLAMELVPGEPLSRRIPADGMPLDELLSVAVALTDAVATAHAAGVVHRDLKPDNVMLAIKPPVKVLDFGLAKLTGDASSTDPRSATMTATQQGAVVGTVAYMSPEQAEGLPVDARSDVFCLGTVLYEMATGRRPFTGQTTMSTITAILRDTPPSVGTVRANVPPTLAGVIERCLEKDPARRYPDAGALRDALRTVRLDEPVRPHRAAGRRARVAVAVLGVVAALTLAGWWWFGRASKETPPPPAVARIADGHTVAVMGFENLNDPEDVDKLGRVLMGLVTTDLVESRGLEVLSTARVLSAIRDAGGSVARGFDLSVADRAAAGAGADVMLVGQVNRDGTRILLAAELVDVPSGRTLGSIRREAGSNSQLFELAGSIAEEVRRQLGVSPSGAGTTPFDLAESLTASPDAYRQYAAGELELHLSHFEAAAGHFESAIEIDPEFALAYYRLGMARSWAGTDDRDALERGLPYIDRLPDHWQRIYLAYLAYRDARWTDAWNKLEPLVEQGVPIPDLHYVLSEIVTHSSRYWDPHRVRELSERTLELDPTFATAWYHLLQAYRLEDDRDALAAAVEQLKRQSGDREVALSAELTLLAAERRYDELGKRYDESGVRTVLARSEMLYAWVDSGQGQRTLDAGGPALADPNLNNITITHVLALASTSLGRFDEACARFEEAIDLGATASRASSNYLLGPARVGLLTGDLDGALAGATEATTVDRENGAAWYWLGRAQIERGDVEAAASTLAELRSVMESTPSPLGEFWTDLLDAEVRLARSDATGALAILDRVAERPVEYRDRPLEGMVRGRALTAAGDTTGAIAAYREVLDPPYLSAGEQGTPWLGWPIYRIELLYPLALLELQSGETDRALEHLDAYVTHWGNADHAVTGIDDARRKLADAATGSAR